MNRIAEIEAALDRLPPMPADGADYTEWDNYNGYADELTAKMQLHGADWLRYLLARVKAADATLRECAEAADFVLSDPGVTFDDAVTAAKFIKSKANKALAAYQEAQDGE
jgi:hypothetical protein